MTSFNPNFKLFTDSSFNISYLIGFIVCCRCSLPFGAAVPVLPVRNNLRRPNSGHFSQPRLHFRKGLAARCSWKCTAICFIAFSIVLTATIAYMAGQFMMVLFDMATILD